ncbi:MAG: class I SAM-dependent methyltransferase [Synechococcus sp. WH 8007]|nr:class I SAM-dependent methyltransferase [Synechococcus sp. WH 8007]
MASLDFDGDYGRHYDQRIRRLIPAYDAHLELAAAALGALVPTATSALVVGPGAGEELPGLLRAMPGATLQLVEPSEQMRGFCNAVIAEAQAGQRITWGPNALEEVAGRFDAVICQNVLHLLPPAEQEPVLHQLCARVGPGGVLVISGFSEEPGADMELWQAIARARFQSQGMDSETIERVMASRNAGVYSVDADRLATQLRLAQMEPPTPLLQALFNRLWFSRRPRSQ